MQEVSGVRLPNQERERVEQLVKLGYYLTAADFLRDAVRAKLSEFEFVVPRKLNMSDVKKEVLAAIKDKPSVYADEIATELNLDIETVIHAIEALIKEKKVVA
jgi:Arc/MetJ-type ribon-helix-helix transcriptional regulator